MSRPIQVAYILGFPTFQDARLVPNLGLIFEDARLVPNPGLIFGDARLVANLTLGILR